MMGGVRRWRTAIAVGALGALAPVLASVPAAARPTPQVTVELAGSLTIAWQGDQARGCAAEGLCGVTGSLQMVPTGASSQSPGPPPIEVVDQNSAARVTSVSGATEVTCADLVPVDFEFAIKHTGGLHAVVEPDSSQQLPSAGRCAGPTAADLSALTLPARKLGSHGYNLSGQTTFGAGPFTVTAISTVRALFTRGASGIGALSGLGGIGSVSTENAEVEYRIESIDGSLGTTFAGLPAPLCDPLGACGTTGELSENFSTSGTLAFFGSRFVKRRVGAQAALEDLRAGRLQVNDSFDGIPIEETASETLAGPDGATCSDTAAEGPLTGQSSQTRHHAVELKLFGGEEPFSFGPGGVDALRTRCPGPSAADVLGTSPLAAGALPLSALGAHSMTATLRSGGSFTGSAYTGQRSGSVVLALVFEHSSGGTNRVPVFSIPHLP
jgi:hypothetical protein